MKIAAGRSFYELMKSRAQTLVPDLGWALVEANGSWSDSPDDCDLLVLEGDTYTGVLVERVVKIPGLRWAHTEDAGTDGFFYDTMRARGVPSRTVQAHRARGRGYLALCSGRPRVGEPVSNNSHILATAD
jgi:hypothetical protein